MSKSPTKADLVAIINNLELRIAQLSTQPPVVSAAEAQAQILAHFDQSPECDACGGTGVHESGGMCYRCKGKGWQDASDVARNAAYVRVRSARTEIAGQEGYASLRAIPAELKAGKRIVRIDGLFYCK